MKLSRHLTAVCFVVILTLAVISGCATRNPNAGKIDPATGKPIPEYGPNPTAKGIGDTLSEVGVIIPPPWGTVLAGIGVVAGGIAVGVANSKNKQLQSVQAAKDQLAASVAAQAPSVVQSILDHASFNEKEYPAVADAINRKTPVNPDGTPGS